MRLLRLSERGAAIVDGWLDGAPVGPGDGEQRLARRLVDAGVLHPLPAPSHGRDLTVDVVVPVRDDVAVGDTIRSAATIGARQIVVVDDASRRFEPVATAVADAATDVTAAVRLERRRVCGGPGAARNTGWKLTDADVVFFVDAGVVVDGGLDAVLGHFADTATVAAAPRVVARPHDPAAPQALDAYEGTRSPLDMGGRPARVAPGSPVSYVPTAALAVRRDAVAAAGGFDETLRYGEDVDLVWRLVESGGDVRYEPTARVSHPNRPGWSDLARQRLAYGSSAAELDASHPGALTPVAVNAWSVGSWISVAFGGARGAALGIAAGGVSALALAPKLEGRVDRPWTEALRIGGFGHLRAGWALATACRRPWLPALVVAAVVSRRARRLMWAVVVGVPLVEWVRDRPRLDPLRWVAARLVDDAAYSAGVWSGCWRRRCWGPLMPRFTRMPWLGSDDA